LPHGCRLRAFAASRESPVHAKARSPDEKRTIFILIDFRLNRWRMGAEHERVRFED